MAKDAGALSALKVKPMYGLAIEEDDDVDEAMRRVMDAYTARQQRNYDPSLMAIGQGLLASRGNFGEAVGMAAKSYEDIQAKLRQEEIDTSAANLQLAQSRRDQALMRRKTQAQAGLFGSESGGDGPADEMFVDPDAFKQLVKSGVDPQIAMQMMKTSGSTSGKRKGPTAEGIADYISRYGAGPETEQAIKLLTLQDAAFEYKDGILFNRRTGIATRVMPAGLPEAGADIKDTPTAVGSHPMDSRNRILYNHVASVGGVEEAKKFMEVFKATGVAPPWAEKSYNTELIKPKDAEGQLDVSLLTLSGKLNSVKTIEDLKKVKLNPSEVKILGSLNRITEAQGNVQKLSDFDKQVFGVATKLMSQFKPVDLTGMDVAIEAVGGKAAGESPVDLSVPAAPKAAAPVPVAAPAPAAPAPAAAAPAPAKAAAPAVVAPAPAAKAATSAAPSSAAPTVALPPPPVRRANPPALTGVPSTQQIAERESQIKAIDEQHKADMKAWELQYGTAAKDRDRPLDSEQKKKEALDAADVAAEVESRKDFIQRRKDADETITIANIFREFSKDPKAKDMFGILNNEKISSGIATLIRDGIGLPGFTVGTKSIEDVMRNAGLNAADQAKYRTFLMYATQMQLQQSKYLKGAVSDYEQRLMANAGITASDTPETIRMKADLLSRRAQFDRRAAKAFKNSKMTAEDYLDSDEYSQMRDKYNQDLAELASGGKILVAPPKASASGKAEPSPGYIIDSVTGVVRKKRAGE